MWLIIGLALLTIALVLSLAAIILSAKGRKNSAGRGMGTAGLIISIITTVVIFLSGFFIGGFVWPGFLNRSGPAETYYPSVKVVEEPVDAVQQKVEEVDWDADW